MRPEPKPSISKDVAIAELAVSLDRICASPSFRRSPRLQRFLRYVTERALQEPGRQLKEYEVAIAVFDKAGDFDPQLDPIVRVEAGRLRLRLIEYYAGPGQQDRIVIEMPKGGYLPSFQLLPTQPQELSQDNSAAYRLCMRGRYLWGKRTAEDLTRAAEYFRRALNLDSSCTHAYVGLADCYAVLGTFGFVAPGEACPKAKAAAMAALEIDRHLPEAYTTLALISAFYEWDWTRAEEEFKRAIDTYSNYALAHQWYGAYLVAVGRCEDGLKALKTAEELEPLGLMVETQLAAGLYVTRRYIRAEEACRAALELEPNFWPAHYFLGLICEQQNLTAQAIQQLQNARELSGENALTIASLGHAYAHAGSTWEADRILEDLQARAKATYVAPFAIALLQAGLKNAEAALVELASACRERSPWLGIFLSSEPRLDFLRSHTRFRDIAATMGLSKTVSAGRPT